MNCGFNFGGCGCNSCMPTFCQTPFGFGGCQNFGGFGGFNGGFGGSNWFAIVLVIFLLLIICGCILKFAKGLP